MLCKLKSVYGTYATGRLKLLVNDIHGMLKFIFKLRPGVSMLNIAE